VGKPLRGYDELFEKCCVLYLGVELGSLSPLSTTGHPRRGIPPASQYGYLTSISLAENFGRFPWCSVDSLFFKIWS